MNPSGMWQTPKVRPTFVCGLLCDNQIFIVGCFNRAHLVWAIEQEQMRAVSPPFLFIFPFCLNLFLFLPQFILVFASIYSWWRKPTDVPLPLPIYHSEKIKTSRMTNIWCCILSFLLSRTRNKWKTNFFEYLSHFSFSDCKYWKKEASSIMKFPESYSQTLAEKTLNLSENQ